MELAEATDKLMNVIQAQYGTYSKKRVNHQQNEKAAYQMGGNICKS